MDAQSSGSRAEQSRQTLNPRNVSRGTSRAANYGDARQTPSHFASHGFRHGSRMLAKPAKVLSA